MRGQSDSPVELLNANSDQLEKALQADLVHVVEVVSTGDHSPPKSNGVGNARQ